MTPVSPGRHGDNESVSARDVQVRDDAHDSDAASVNASTVAVRIVALAAMAPPGRTVARNGTSRHGEGEGTEAS